ncbi:phospholipase D-like domain-containing protein [Synechococcus sp. PCC 6312]|uniref:phospholipase D-like domain-containing protein n=1 Tax=Synechococcus sp. (strain ATCC 27167 / PCC 6312) TaxID=195253 RepID=UPI00029F2D53|nr:phospholipase D-like domain-containing protein [Synechococcus sp. PCC 6312]AFY61369.1 phosphatidylserine/phosphatidylglycerophosphate/cardiolipin synthase [Synechococcus sp. PCC 6312]
MFTPPQNVVKFLRKHWRSGILFLIGLLIALIGVTQCQREELKIGGLSPLPQHPYIKAHMNHDQAFTYTEPYRDMTREGENFEQIMIDGIKGAKFSIDFAVQEFRLPLLAQALVERKKAGVNVRVVMENTYSRTWASYSQGELDSLGSHMQDRYRDWLNLVDTNGDGRASDSELGERDAITILNQGGVPWIDDTADGSAGSMLMHHKFIVIDGQQVIATSANFTLSDVHGDIGAPDTRGNANSLLDIDSPQLAALFIEEFNIMWGDGPGGKLDSLFGVKKPFRPTQRVQIGDATVDVKFSPASRRIPWEDTTNGLINHVFTTARKSIDMALFVFSDQQLVNTLEAKHSSGIGIRTLVDPGFVYRDFSEALDMLGVAMANTGQAKRGKCYYEAGNRPWTNPIQTVGTPDLPKGDKLHHKYGVIDSQTVIMGSHNWSEAANRGNDEYLLVVYHPTVAAHYVREFERLYANAKLGLPDGIKTKIAKQLQDCDGKIETRTAATGSSRQRTSVSSEESGVVTLPDIGAGDESTTTAPKPPRKPRTKTPASDQSASTSAPSSTRRESANERSTSATGSKINVNTASESELTDLPGVGPKVAAAIVKARSGKPFTSLDDLDAVPGIGPKILERIKDQVAF